MHVGSIAEMRLREQGHEQRQEQRGMGAAALLQDPPGHRSQMPSVPAKLSSV